MCDLAELKEVLNAQCNVHQKLLTLEAEKTEILMSGDAQALLPLLNEQQALLMQSREMEKKRNTICSESPFPTLKEMIQASEESKSVLGDVFQELSAIVATLKKKCSLNRKLIDTRLTTIRFLAGQNGVETGPNTYSKR